VYSQIPQFLLILKLVTTLLAHQNALYIYVSYVHEKSQR